MPFGFPSHLRRVRRVAAISDRFFELFERYLAGDPGQSFAPAGEALEVEPPAPAASQARQP